MGLEETIISTGIPMKGRMLHSQNGERKEVLYDPTGHQVRMLTLETLSTVRSPYCYDIKISKELYFYSVTVLWFGCLNLQCIYSVGRRHLNDILLTCERSLINLSVSSYHLNSELKCPTCKYVSFRNMTFSAS